MGVGEPKLITSFTMSAGSNESRKSATRASATSAGTLSRFHFSAVHFFRCAGSFSRNRAFRSSMRTLPGLSATRMTDSSGPPIQR